jgi:hypothetical protein
LRIKSNGAEAAGALFLLFGECTLGSLLCALCAGGRRGGHGSIYVYTTSLSLFLCFLKSALRCRNHYLICARPPRASGLGLKDSFWLDKHQDSACAAFSPRKLLTANPGDGNPYFLDYCQAFLGRKCLTVTKATENITRILEINAC